MDLVSYRLVDSSQLIHLCDIQRISILDSPGFIAKYGYPFLTTHNIFEMAGTDDIETFRKRLCMVSSLETVHSLNLPGIESLGSIPTLQAVELSAIVDIGAADYSRIRQRVRQYIRKIRFAFTNEEVEAIYTKCSELRKLTSFLATFNNEMMSPEFDMPVGDLEGRVMDPNATAKLTDRYREILRLKGIVGEAADELVSTFLYGQERTRPDVEYSSDALANLQRLTGREIDPKVGLDSYMNIYLFKEHVAKSARILGRLSSDFDCIRETDSRVFQLEVGLKRQLESRLSSDTRRKVEYGNTTDLFLAAYALVVDVFADKRTVELTNQVNEDLKYDLSMDRVIYDL